VGFVFTIVRVRLAMKQKAPREVEGFVVEVHNRTILVLSAASMSRARKLCSQNWFAEELLRYRSRGARIWDGKAQLSIRRAKFFELAELEIARAKELAREQQDEFAFAFLIPLDAEVH
jgi:hypothetical protein